MLIYLVFIIQNCFPPGIFVSYLLNHPKFSTSTSGVQFLLLFRWWYGSLRQNSCIPALYYLFNPSFLITTKSFNIYRIIFTAVYDIQKCSLHNSVFQTMEWDDSKSSSTRKGIKTGTNWIFKCVEFIIDCYSQSLKNSCCCLNPALSTSCLYIR